MQSGHVQFYGKFTAQQILTLTFTVHLTVEMSQPYYTDFSIILWNTCMVHSLPIMKLNHSHHYGFAVHFACMLQSW